MLMPQTGILENETPPGQNETDLGNFYEKWAKEALKSSRIWGGGEGGELSHAEAKMLFTNVETVSYA